LLCSHLALLEKSEFTPLTLREWNPLAVKIAASSLASPGGMSGLKASDLSRDLEIKESEALRLAFLLERGGGLAIELERLASLGIHPITRADREYPIRLRERLAGSAPAVLFYAGNLELVGQPGIAVVGSRNLDQTGEDCAKLVGNACGLLGKVLYSGGARGVDSISMKAALDNRGFVVGLLADSLTKAIRVSEYRSAISRGDMCVVSSYHPEAGFSVGAAMGRNRLIYALSDFAIVIASDAQKGGTWAGASEALRSGWTPVFVLEHARMPEKTSF
jgi:predicted Rossmann fold nucleotide-binding protein DprA/Smf involved in DNA uptake